MERDKRKAEIDLRYVDWVDGKTKVFRREEAGIAPHRSGMT
jgi:hypothetical protein